MTTLALMKPSRALPAVLASLFLASPALADFIAGDSYTIGSNPLAGQYTTATPPGPGLKNQPGTLTTTGFVTGPYNQGSGTSNFIAEAGGLSTAGYNTTPAANDGDVKFLGAGNGSDNTVRSVARAFSAVPASTSYFFNILVSQDGSAVAATNSFVLAGFGNNTVPLLGATSNEVQGLYFGFAQHGAGSDLVIRYRNGMDTTADATLVAATSGTARVFDIVAQLTVSLSGPPNGNLSYWVNPTDFSSTSALTATSLVSGSFATQAYAPSGASNDPIANFSRLTYTTENYTGVAKFDEVRFGTALGDVAPAGGGAAVPEPASIVLLGLGLIGGLGVARRRRASSAL